MKNFGKLIGTLVLAGVIFSSCQQEMIQPGSADIALSELPESAVQFISMNYDLSGLNQASKYISQTGKVVYEASFSWGTDLYFGEKGDFRGSRDDDNGNDDYIPVDDLPQVILDYISTTYQLAIVEAEINHHPDGSYSFEVELSNGTEVYFDQSGNFILEDDNGGQKSGDSNHIPTTNLPQAILDYIQTQFPNLSIVKAEKKLNPGGSFRKYEIELSNGMELYFDEAGKILMDDSPSPQGGFDDSFDIPVSELPQKTRDYIADHYPGRTITRAKKKLNDDKSVRSYEARLSDKTKVFFDAEGNFTGSDN